MILVVADDLSGAAELAGIAFAHGLTAEVQTELQPRTEAQVICLDTDTRRLEPEAAAAGLRKLTRRLKAASPEFIFKKTDSALRGNIGAELGVLLEITARVRAVKYMWALFACNDLLFRRFGGGCGCVRGASGAEKPAFARASGAERPAFASCACGRQDAQQKQEAASEPSASDEIC